MILCHRLYRTHTGLTNTLNTIAWIPGWTWATLITRNIGRSFQVCASGPLETRLSVQFACVNVALAEPSCVPSGACASLVNKLAVIVIFVAHFWRHTLATISAGAHFDTWCGTRGSAEFVGCHKWELNLTIKSNSWLRYQILKHWETGWIIRT